MTKRCIDGKALETRSSDDEDQLSLFEAKVPLPTHMTPGTAGSHFCKHCEETYLSVDAVAERYCVSRATIWRWVEAQPNFPKPAKLSPGTTRWKLCDLAAFEASVGTTGA